MPRLFNRSFLETGIIVIVTCFLLYQISPSKNTDRMALSAHSVLVTGASRGLGLELVKQLVTLPNAPEVVIATCRTPEKSTALQALAKANPSIKVVKMDVVNDAEIEAAVKEVQALLGDRGLNLLINNAGIYDQSVSGKLETQTREIMQRHFDINVSGPLIVSQKFLPLIKLAAKQNPGDLSFSRAGIVMITSHMGSQTLTFESGLGTAFHYKCSKSALIMASIMLSQELKDDGIIVVALHPGWVSTDMGGPSAITLPEESIKGCLSVIGSANESKNGRLLSYENKDLPF